MKCYAMMYLFEYHLCVFLNFWIETVQETRAPCDTDQNDKI